MTRCQYCDQPLQTTRALEVHWQVRTGGGAVGRGVLRVSAPASAGAEPARVAAEAAFGAALTALGPGATPEQVQPLMAQRLPALLPAGHTLEALTVEEVSAFVPVARGVDAPHAAPFGAPAAAGSGCAPLACLALAMGLCCVSSGLLGLLGGEAAAEDAARLRTATVMTADEARRTTGYVVVENVLPTAGDDAPVTSDGTVCLWLSEPLPGKAVQRWATSFRVGDLEVRPDGQTRWDEPVSLVAAVGTRTPAGATAVRADRPVTVAGDAANGVIAGGRGSIVSTRPSRDAILRDLEHQARSGRIAMIVLTGLGALLLVAAWFLRRRR
ncbi:MAG: hypothetical protein KF878_17775 [Planctomycetes bacterium]|nr:hypothetical protein [Planctomycetota bacterium]